MPTFNIGIEFTPGSFTQIGSDVLHAAISRTLADAQVGLSSGQLHLQLDNFSGKYSPENSGGAYYGLLTPNKRVQVTEAQSGYYLFTGYLDEMTVAPALTDRTVEITANDFIKKIQNVHITTSLFANINATSMFTEVLSAANITSLAFTVDAMAEIIPFAWGNDVTLSQMMVDLMRLGNYYAYVAGNGTLNIKNRYFNILSATSVGSFVNSFYALGYTMNDTTMVNRIMIEAHPRALSAVSTIGWISDAILLPSRTAIGFNIDFRDPLTNELKTPAMSLVTPVMSSDYLVSISAVATTGNFKTSLVSVSVLFKATTAVCTVYNPDRDNLYLTKFQIRGAAASKQPTVNVQQDISSSQNAYGVHAQTLKSDFISSVLYANDYAGFIIGQFKDPTPTVKMTIKNRYPEALAIELGQLITIVESHTAVGSRWMVTGIEHDLLPAHDLEHTVDYAVAGMKGRGWLILDDPNCGILDAYNAWGF